MRTIIVAFACCAAFLLLGCGDGSPKLDSQDLQAFNSASPELKASWEKALSLDKANDYAAAGAAYFSLLRQNLSPEQLQAVQTASAAMNRRMYDAAAAGDAAAQKAIDSLQVGRKQRECLQRQRRV